MPFRDEALLDAGDEDEESDVRPLSTLRDLRHCSGSSRFRGPPLPRRWLLLNWLISCPTDTKESVSTELWGRAGGWLMKGVLAGAGWPLWPSAGSGILGRLAAAVGGGGWPGGRLVQAAGGTTKLRLLLSGS